MADLLDNDGALESGLLSIVTLKLDTSLVVANAIGGSRRMVADLLRDKGGLASFVGPGTEEKLTQERVQRLLFVSKLLTSAGVLVLQSREEPLEDEHSTLGGIRLGSWGGQDGRVRGPVRREFGEGLRGQDEGRRGERR